MHTNFLGFKAFSGNVPYIQILHLKKKKKQNAFKINKSKNVFKDMNDEHKYPIKTAVRGLRTWAIICMAWLHSEIREMVKI